MIIDITASVHIKFFVFSFILLPTTLTNANHLIAKKIIVFLRSFTNMQTLAAILGFVSTLHQPSFIIIKPSIFLSSFIYQTQQNLFPSTMLSTEEESTSSERFIFIYLSTYPHPLPTILHI